MSRTPATHSAYTLALRNFAVSCSKIYLEEIDRLDLLQHATYKLRDVADLYQEAKKCTLGALTYRRPEHRPQFRLGT